MLKKDSDRSRMVVLLWLGYFLIVFSAAPWALGVDKDFASQRDKLISEIQRLDGTATGAWKHTFQFTPNGNRVRVFMTSHFEYNGKSEQHAKQTLTMPGSFAFKAVKGAGGWTTEIYGNKFEPKRYWRIGNFDEHTAVALANALGELNTLCAKNLKK